MRYEDGDITNISDKDIISVSNNNVIDSLAGSPEIRKPSKNNPPNKMIELRESDASNHQMMTSCSAL